MKTLGADSWQRSSVVVYASAAAQRSRFFSGRRTKAVSSSGETKVKKTKAKQQKVSESKRERERDR